MAKIIIPTPLRKFTEQAATYETNSFTVEQAIEDLVTQYPDLKNHLLDNQGRVRSFIKVFLGEDDIRSLQDEQTEIDDNSVISIVPAIAGGSI
jgi:molybdopterin converting factor small subunit